MSFPIISADSHITEPAGTYIDRIDRKWKDRAPRMIRDEKAGDVFVVDGMSKPIPMGLVAAAGKPAEEIRVIGVHFEDTARRVLTQDQSPLRRLHQIAGSAEVPHETGRLTHFIHS